MGAAAPVEAAASAPRVVPAGASAAAGPASGLLLALTAGPTGVVAPASGAPALLRPSVAPDAPAARPHRRSVPSRVTVPGIGVDRPLIGLDVLDDGTIEAPRRFEDVGWWQDGPTPGEEGAAVLVGHVDSQRGPAVFAELATLRAGERVTIGRADGSTLTFAVTGKEQVAKDRFPADRIYRDAGPPGLAIITCGGTFDRRSGHYLDNIVVFADLVPKA